MFIVKRFVEDNLTKKPSFSSKKEGLMINLIRKNLILGISSREQTLYK